MRPDSWDGHLVRAVRSRPAVRSKNQALASPRERPARGPAADEGVRPTTGRARARLRRLTIGAQVINLPHNDQRAALPGRILHGDLAAVAGAQVVATFHLDAGDAKTIATVELALVGIPGGLPLVEGESHVRQVQPLVGGAGCASNRAAVIGQLD